MYFDLWQDTLASNVMNIIACATDGCRYVDNSQRRSSAYPLCPIMVESCP